MARSSTRTDLLPRAGCLVALAAAPWFTLLSGCCRESDSPAAARGEAAGAPAGGPAVVKGPVVVSLSIDWEGAYFEEDGLEAMARFRDENPDVPITHFVSAAYFTKPAAVRAEVTAFLRDNVREGDEVGVHLHAWNSLVQAAKVPVRSGRSFLTPDGRLLEFDGDAGFDVDPTIYTVSELRSILATSRALLETTGLKVAPVFRTAGWLAGPSMLEAARAEGFTVDSSSTDSTWLRGGDASENFDYLAALVHERWPKVDRTTQPFLIDTPAGPILEVPDSGAMADQVTSEEMEDHVQWAANQPKRPIFVHLGFHAETAHNFAALLSRALANLRRRKVAMQFVTVTGAAELARAGLASPKK